MKTQVLTGSKLCAKALLMILAWLPAFAQAPNPEITVTVSRDRVRFAAPGDAQEMRVEVFSPTGERLFEGDLIAGQAVDWPLQDAQGKSVESGLYAYAITVKGQDGNTKQVQRGNVIVGRVTVEGELEVSNGGIKFPDKTVQTTAATDGDNATGAKTKPEPDHTKRTEASATDTLAATNGTITGEGIAGTIAKFTGANTIGNSTIIESSGKIGIGINPASSLHLLVPGSSSQISAMSIDVQTFGTAANSVASHYFRVRDMGAGGFTPFYIRGDGNVGIGTATPGQKLSVRGSETAPHGFGAAIGLSNFAAGGGNWYLRAGAIGTLTPAGGFSIADDADYRLSINKLGNVGIGTINPLEKLHVAGSYLRVDGAGNEQVYIGGDGFGNDVQLGSSNPNVTTVALWNSALGRRMNLYVGTLTITGGSDLAEPFNVSRSEAAKPGMVVAIDPDYPGRLRVADIAYDRTVAGIVSGAGGVNPGMLMSQPSSIADGSHPVALTGRVYCWVDASNGPIEPGDLLTTSNIPGHAMKATDHVKAQGAIIGKAMTGLKEGKGLVLVLVTLQ